MVLVISHEFFFHFQVLTSVRQKVDHYSYTVQNFEALLLRARRTLAQREGLLPDRAHSLTPSPEFIHSKLRSSTINEVPSKGMITGLGKQKFSAYNCNYFLAHQF